jgi:membrane-associated phospholipid phosphatase
VHRSARLLVAGFLLLGTFVASADPHPLKVDLRLDIPILVVTGASAVGLALPGMAPTRCRFCTPNDFDVDARTALRWGHPLIARQASDAILSGLLPLGSAGALALAAHEDGSARTFLEDAVVVAEAVTISTTLNGFAKDGFARIRPAAQDGSMPGSRNKSFYSGHTSLAFALATSTATVASMRGYRSAKLLWISGMVLASAVGYLRVAGDAHWVSDVAVGAVAGGAVGFSVPWFLHRSGSRRGPVELVPAPGGFAMLFP